MHLSVLTALGAALVLLVPPAQAQSAVPKGRLLASNCFQCHGTQGRGPGFDELTGESAGELYKTLKEFQSGEEGNGLMAHHARGFTDAQLRDLSTYLARRR